MTDTPLAGWQPPAPPSREDPAAAQLTGRSCRLAPLEVGHAPALFAANAADRAGEGWHYLGYGPFAVLADYEAWVAAMVSQDDPLFYAILVGDRPVGVASYLRIDAPMGVIEVGHLRYAPALQRTRAATEAMYLMMRWAFAAGYRRYEWKCDAANAPSRRAAQRLGFSFEGVFRQAAVVKGRNRDTAWYAAIDREWPSLREAYERWLDDDNFAADGRQRRALGELTAPILAARG